MTGHQTNKATYWLEQIAAALGIPASRFLQPPREPLSAVAAREQEDELLRLFRDIRDPDLREQILDFLRGAAGRSETSKG